MKKLQTFILEILKNDSESLEIIEAELNNHSIPERSIHIQNNDYFLKQNHGQKFSYEEIKEALKNLILFHHISIKILNNELNEIQDTSYSDKLLELEPMLIWFELSK